MVGVKKARSHDLKLRGLVTRLKKVLQSEYAESVEVYRSSGKRLGRERLRVTGQNGYFLDQV